MLGALLELAGEKAQPVASEAEESLDEAWAEPPVFDGCSTKGQARPGDPQPIRMMQRQAQSGASSMNTYLNNLAFVVYPYVCLAFFAMGSLARFDRDQYTWKSDSSQMLRAGTLRWGSNLFHAGILFLFFGHLFGQLTPHWMYEPLISAPQKQLLAIVAGGVAGAVCFVGLTLLLQRRIFDPRIRLTSHRTDIAILVILWVQLMPRAHHPAAVVGTPPRCRHHADPCLLPAGHRHTAARRRRALRGGLAVQGAHAARDDDIPALSVQSPGARVERLRLAGLSACARTSWCAAGA